jgi:hypothetical protein
LSSKYKASSCALKRARKVVGQYGYSLLCCDIREALAGEVNAVPRDACRSRGHFTSERGNSICFSVHELRKGLYRLGAYVVKGLDKAAKGFGAVFGEKSLLLKVIDQQLQAVAREWTGTAQDSAYRFKPCAMSRSSVSPGELERIDSDCLRKYIGRDCGQRKSACGGGKERFATTCHPLSPWVEYVGKIVVETPNVFYIGKTRA